MPEISVVLPVWITNDELYSLTGKALESLMNSQGWGKCELIIIDNASPIGADQLLSLADIYIRNKVNLGYVKAINQGLKLSQGSLIAVPNNDTRISPNWIQVAKEVFQRDPKAGSLHFKMVGYNEPFNLGDAVWDKGKERWCQCSWFIWRKKAADQIQGLDENYGLGGYDDWDWLLRMRRKGWKSMYTNAAAFQHKDSSTQNILDQEKRKMSDNKNYEYFKSKFGEYPDKMWERLYPEQYKVPWRPYP